MLDRELLRQQPDAVRAGIARKGLDSSVVDLFLSVDAEYRRIKTETGNLQAEANRSAKLIGALMAQGKKDEAEIAKAAASQLKIQVQKGESQERELEAKLHDIELQIPNLPHESVPNGVTESDNVVVRSWGTPRETSEPHWDIVDRLKMVDLARGAKISGSGFPVYTGWGAKLQRALFSFLIDFQTSEGGYSEVYPPYLVNRASLIGTGNLPKFEEDLYKVDDDLYLIPTAEVPITNLYRDEILDGSELPIRLAGYSACFRREAGAAGKDTRGLQRLHQFDKIEMVKFTTPESSYQELESMTADAERALQALELTYRVIEICTGDIGAKGCKQYDLEAWSPGVGKWLEVSSCSNFEAYQARRANIRFRREAGSPLEFTHILNGSSLGIPRTFSAVLETNLQPDGSIRIPPVLRSYMKAAEIR